MTELGLEVALDLTAITTGPFAGALAATDGSTSEVVIFELE